MTQEEKRDKRIGELLDRMRDVKDLLWLADVDVGRQEYLWLNGKTILADAIYQLREFYRMGLHHDLDVKEKEEEGNEN